MTAHEGKTRLLMELRGQGIADTRVLEALETVPRDLFVPEGLVDQAWHNRPLPIGNGQTISQPLVVAAMTAGLEIADCSRVLEVGTGSGYQAAVLARLARRVYTVERHRDLLIDARRRFEILGLDNVSTRLGDGSRGWPEAAPFDRIMVTAAARRVPESLMEQLAADGIMIVPVGEDAWHQSLTLIRRTGGGPVAETLMHVRFVPLVEGDDGPRAGG